MILLAHSDNISWRYRTYFLAAAVVIYSICLLYNHQFKRWVLFTTSRRFKCQCKLHYDDVNDDAKLPCEKQIFISTKFYINSHTQFNLHALQLLGWQNQKQKCILFSLHKRHAFFIYIFVHIYARPHTRAHTHMHKLHLN